MSKHRSYLGYEIQEQLIANLKKEDKEIVELSRNTLEKYWYNSRYTPPNDNDYYFVGRKKGKKNYILERDEEKSPKL